MKTLLLALAIASLTLSASAIAEDKAKDVNKEAVVRELDANKLFDGWAFAQRYRLLRINAEALPKVFPNEEMQKRLKKEIDFTKQELILFAWSSGGDDTLTYSVPQGGTLIIFRYEGGTNKKDGREKQLKSQVRAFAIPKDAPWTTSGWPFVDPHSIPKRSSPR